MRWAIRNNGGVSENGLGMPRGVNHNDKTVMINPPGRTWRGVNENFSPAKWRLSWLSVSFLFGKGSFKITH